MGDGGLVLFPHMQSAERWVCVRAAIGIHVKTR